MFPEEMSDDRPTRETAEPADRSERGGRERPASDVTRILSAIEHGDGKAAEQLLPVVYDELRKLAAAKMAQENPGQTLQATALVHEAYIRLVDVEKAQHWDSRGHFFSAAAEAMRRILVNRARDKGRMKRGGHFRRVDLDKVAIATDALGDDLLALDEAVERLAEEQREATEDILYVAHMRLAQKDWEDENTIRLHNLLERHLPEPGGPDRRGWEWYYWLSQCHMEKMTLQTRSLMSPSAAWSPDGQYIASASSDEGAWVWDAKTGEKLFAVCGPGCLCVAWSQDGRRLASGGFGSSVKIWDTKDGRELFSLVGHTNSINDVAWSPDGTRVASTARDGVLIMWDATTGSEVASFRGGGFFSRVTWSGDGRRLMAHSGELSYWDNWMGSWSADGRHLMAGSGTMMTWDASSGYDDISSSAYARQRARALYRRGLQFARSGRKRESNEVFREARALDTASPIAYLWRGKTYEEQGEIAEALADYTEAIRLEADLATPYRWRARLHLQHANLEAAIRDAKAAVRIAPRERDNWYTLGLLQYGAGKWGVATASLEKSQELSHGEQVDALLLLAMTHWQLGETDQSQQCYRKAVERIHQHDYTEQVLLSLRDEAPSFMLRDLPEAGLPEVLWRLRRGDRFWKSEQYSQAIEENRGAVTVLEQLADRSREQTEVRDHLAKAYLSLGRRLYGLERREEAKAILEKVREAFPDEPECAERLGRTYERQDSVELDHADSELVGLSRKIRLNPDSAQAYADRGKAYFEMYEYDKAIVDFSEAIQLEPTYAEHYWNRRAVYWHKGNWQNALADVDQLVRLRGSAADYRARGNVYQKMHMYDKAMIACNEAVRLDPMEPWNYLSRGWTFLSMGQLDKAEDDLDRAIRHDPIQQRLFFVRGLVHKEKANLKSAVADFTQSLRLDPQLGLSYAQRAFVYAELGQTDAARADLDMAAKLTPKSHDHKACLACFLASRDGELCRAERALELADQAVKKAPKFDEAWEARGMAQYRLGNWQKAADALTKSIEVSVHPIARTWLFLAMARWQLGEKDKAQRCYQEALQRLEKREYVTRQLRRLRSEAAELLGIEKQHENKREAAGGTE